MNPLLDWQGDLPPFAKIRTEHIKPAVTQCLQQNRAEIKTLIAALKTKPETCTWENTLAVLEALEDRLEHVWSPVQHLHNVADSEALRVVYNDCQTAISEYYHELEQNPDLYKLIKTLSESPAAQNFEAAQQQIIKNQLRDFHLSGIDQPPEKQKKLLEIQQQMSSLRTRFSENLLDATHGWTKHITDENQLQGIPENVIHQAALSAEKAGRTGWLLTLDAPCYLPVMKYAKDAELRREMYRAFSTRASDQGDHAGRWDNTETMQKLLGLRQELSHLLSFKHYAEYSLARKMAHEPEQVLEFLHDLAHRVRPFAERELAALQHFARERDGLEQLGAEDMYFYSEALREHHYAISQEALRPWFPLPQVLAGLFQVVQRLYGLNIRQKPVENTIEVWHSSVSFYEIYDAKDNLRGAFYLDPYARKGKRGGAWMADCRNRRKTATGIQYPIAYLVCNFPQPVKDHPSLLSHEEVQTLFHEFGHGLHHLLTRIDYAGVAGINGVPWDAVELPSQFMENWCWEKEALQLFARHYETGEVLPEATLEKMLAAKNFQVGLFILRQLEFALFDFRLHCEYQAGKTDIQQLLGEVREEVAVMIPPAFNRFQHSFGHIFSGGYAAGYYSYQWANVLAADAFSLFEENGIFDKETGQKFLQNILELGGSQDPEDLFIAFRGRAPKLDALLKHSGLQT
ncbi:M3 family metallopeptidase [Candidatus Venteria ishoeyi]|uniref:M3 family metallopeptidase n=1 Tax=Candidatus Venteria ishoeyi TaxID=1899563 RepID=UPI0025A5B139|nr:M3 family metallopeptidase [Candidatus Venteria ishoeyi]MDM8547287.1 M3 family metallopeptidase [Candidatus Venteria ishoeyi]